MRRGFCGLLTVVAAVSMATPAWAYCRATTCDPDKQQCRQDSLGCLRDGLPVAWTSSCVTVNVQADGAPHAGIDFETARASVERAFAAWTDVECPGGGKPAIQVNVEGPVSCAKSEYNSDKHNANIIMFRDDFWPYAGQSQDDLGFTRINFDPDSGELYDVDIELNAVSEPLSVEGVPAENEVDLDSLIMHEVGHLLGLNHTRDAAATMAASYLKGSAELRTPASDDIEGICTIYPPDRDAATDDCEPRHGFSELCGADQPEPMPPLAGGSGGDDPPVESAGCSLMPANNEQPAPIGVSWLLIGLLGLVRRRSANGH